MDIDVPNLNIEELVILYHEEYGHLGSYKVTESLTEHFYFKDMYRKVARIIRSCDICQETKVNTTKYEESLCNITSNKKLEKIFIDISTGRVPKYIY